MEDDRPLREIGYLAFLLVALATYCALLVVWLNAPTVIFLEFEDSQHFSDPLARALAWQLSIVVQVFLYSFWKNVILPVALLAILFLVVISISASAIIAVNDILRPRRLSRQSYRFQKRRQRIFDRQLRKQLPLITIFAVAAAILVPIRALPAFVPVGLLAVALVWIIAVGVRMTHVITSRHTTRSLAAAAESAKDPFPQGRFNAFLHVAVAAILLNLAVASMIELGSVQMERVRDDVQTVLTAYGSDELASEARPALEAYAQSDSTVQLDFLLGLLGGVPAEAAAEFVPALPSSLAYSAVRIPLNVVMAFLMLFVLAELMLYRPWVLGRAQGLDVKWPELFRALDVDMPVVLVGAIATVLIHLIFRAVDLSLTSLVLMAVVGVSQRAI